MLTALGEAPQQRARNRDHQRPILEVVRAQRRLQDQAPLRRGQGHEVAETLGIALTTGRMHAEVEQWSALLQCPRNRSMKR